VGDVEHVMEIGQSFLSGDWSVGCSCGWWTEREYTFRAAAIEDWDNHCDVVFMEATGG
jgi:hypothetical protein